MADDGRVLFRTDIVIWSRFDPGEMELEDLAHDAQSGMSYCSEQRTTAVPVAEVPEMPEGMAGFFGLDEKPDGGEEVGS